MRSIFSPKIKKYGQSKGQNSRFSIKRIIRLTSIFLMIISLGVGLGLFEASLSGKQEFWKRLESVLNFANPTSRFVYIYPGLRREQIVEKYAETLNWTDKDKRWFLASAPTDPETGNFQEGYFLPKGYIVDKDATGKEVGEIMHEEFLETISEKILSDQSHKSKINGAVINLDTAVKIASIIQREAAGPQDMRLISGIIWNRIFKGMSLDLDATLQYAKGTEDNWWPKVESKDKYIESPYNTYKYKGVPPGAISNPSIEAIQAVYNPEKTSCLFYLHDKNGIIHCTKTYEDHKKNIETYLR